jgi:hypothetical protein
MSHWLFNNKILNEAPENAFGFIYKITNTTNDKMYIGRKYFEKKRRVKKKGQSRRKVIRKSSDWQTYTGSSKPLNESISKLGKSKFKFEILEFGYTKGQVNYLEENIQHRLQVILDDRYYNDCIGSRKWLSVKFNDKQKQNLLSKVNKI